MGGVGAVVGCCAWLGGTPSKEEATREEKMEMAAVCWEEGECRLLIMVKV